MTEDKRPSILVVDDAKSNVDVLLELLSDDYAVAVALNGPDALELALQEPPDLLLLDIVMPGMDGFAVCQALKASPVTRDIPVIFITGMTEEGTIETAFTMGGVDYVTKPFKPRELLARVRTHIQMRQLIRHLEYVSSHDKMTGLHNRARFFELAHQHWVAGSTGLYAGMLDIDHFKRVNDTHGHPVGDRMLQGVAQAIHAVLGDRVTHGRVGGEEFAILWHGCPEDRVLADVKNIHCQVAALEWPLDEGAVVRCTVSVGVSEVGAGMRGLDDLLKAADDALYRAKGTGRNRTVFRGLPLAPGS